MTAAQAIGRLVADAAPPEEARSLAVRAFVDTVGVALAGSAEDAGRITREVVAAEGSGPCTVFGSWIGTSATGAALANGTSAHALDFDDMCFVSLAHPSAPLVPAIWAAGELSGATGVRMLDAYVIGFEVEARLGSVMNPAHYQRGWHCTSTIGTIGAAAAVSHVLGLNAEQAAHAVSIAASAASGLKENFGTMVKPLNAGLAARNGVQAALLARAGFEGSALALEGPQGLVYAMHGSGASLSDAIADLGSRWELLDTGITVKLYPSCAGTHPTLDAVLDMRREHGFGAADVDRVDVEVDSITPTVLIYDRPTSGLEAKFSMPFCVAAAVVRGQVGIDTFESSALSDPAIAALMNRVHMQVDSGFDNDAPALTQARVRIQLRDGRVLMREAQGARGYPANPASDEELDAKFLSCARRAVTETEATQWLGRLRSMSSDNMTK